MRERLRRDLGAQVRVKEARMLWLIGAMVVVGIAAVLAVRAWEREVVDRWWELRSADGE